MKDFAILCNKSFHSFYFFLFLSNSISNFSISSMFSLKYKLEALKALVPDAISNVHVIGKSNWVYTHAAKNISIHYCGYISMSQFKHSSNLCLTLVVVNATCQMDESHLKIIYLYIYVDIHLYIKCIYSVQ